MPCRCRRLSIDLTNPSANRVGMSPVTSRPVAESTRAIRARVSLPTSATPRPPPASDAYMRASPPAVGDSPRCPNLGGVGGTRVTLEEIEAVVEEDQVGNRGLVGERLVEEHALPELGKGRKDGRRDARFLLLGQADPEVESERCRHLVTEERPQGLARHAADQFPDEETEGEGVIPVPCSRLPERLLCRQGARHQVPVVERTAGQVLANGRYPGLASCKRQLLRPGAGCRPARR